MDTLRDFFSQWPDRAKLLQDMNCTAGQLAVMMHRDSIPQRFWWRIHLSAVANEVPDALPQLAKLHHPQKETP